MKDFVLDLSSRMGHFGIGIICVVVGVILFAIYPMTFNNGSPTPDQVVFWQNIGTEIASFGLIYVAINSWRLQKPVEERRHEQLLARLDAMERKLEEHSSPPTNS